MNNSWHEAFLQRTDRPDPDTLPSRSAATLLFGAVAKPLSWIYRASAAVDRMFRYPAPIDLSEKTLLAVVSSPVVGGVGKTPLVAHLATQLTARGHNTAIVASGYGRQSKGYVTLSELDRDATAAQIGDEPLMLHQSTGLPVHVDDDTASAVARLDNGAESRCIVLDNGIRRRWKGERRIVVLSGLDLERPVRFLPDGRWRIAPRHAWPAVGVVIIEDTPDPDRDRHRKTLSAWGFHGPVAWFRTTVDGCSPVGKTGQEDIGSLPDSRPYVFAGLGRPSRFLCQIQELGLTPAGVTRFPDHHPYTAADLQSLQAVARECSAGWLLTTHKDAVKIDPSWVTDLASYYLRISLELTAGADMLSVILEPPR